MKKISFLFAAILFAGSMMASPAIHYSETLTISSGISGNDANNNATLIWKTSDSKIFVKHLKGSGTTNVNPSYKGRVYMGNILAFSADGGYKIDTIILSYDGVNYGNKMTAGTDTTKQTVTDNTTAVDARLYYESGKNDTLINKLGESLSEFFLQNVYVKSGKQLRLTSIYVGYTKLASSNPEVTVGDLSFGTFVPGISNATKASAITATLMMGTSFSISGNLTTEGGTVSITLTDLTDGDKTDAIKFSVGGNLMAESNVDAHVVVTEGLGAKDNPFTVTDVKKLNNTFLGNYWVEGYVLGGVKNHQVDNSDSTAIAMAISMDSPIDTIEVQLPKGAIRDALNGSVTAGKKIKIKGSLESYNNTVGVKNPTEYEIISGPVTAISNTEAIETKTLKVIENGQLFIIKNGVKYNAQGTIVK